MTYCFVGGVSKRFYLRIFEGMIRQCLSLHQVICLDLIHSKTPVQQFPCKSTEALFLGMDNSYLFMNNLTIIKTATLNTYFE